MEVQLAPPSRENERYTSIFPKDVPAESPLSLMLPVTSMISPA